MKQNLLHRMSALLLALALALSLAVPALADGPDIGTDLKISLPPEFTLAEGETDNSSLFVTVAEQPADTTLSYEWSSSDETKVEVSGTDPTAVVKAIGQGTATVTVKVTATSTLTADVPPSVEKTATCTVTVREQQTVAVTGITLSDHEITLEKGKSQTLTAIVSPENATDKTVNWSSSPAGIVTVSGGKVTAMNEGKATVTATAGDQSDKCEVTVTAKQPPPEVTVDRVTLSRQVLTIEPGRNDSLQVTVYYSSGKTNTSTSAVEWTTSNSEVATVQGGRVYAQKPGTAIITATSKEDKSKSVDCTVTVPNISVSGVQVTPSQRLDVGGTAVITATVTPSNADNRNITWKSEDEKVVTVNQDGLLTGVAPGKTQIIVTTEDGNHTAACEVEVSGITISPATLNLMVNKADNLNYEQFGAAIGAGRASWESEDTSIASVSSGRVTGRSIGTTKITVTIGTYTATATVTVGENTTGLIKVDGSIQAGTPFRFEDLRDRLDSTCRTALGTSLTYITNVTVPTNQGILYYNYVSPDDPGSGVATSTDKFYYSESVNGQRTISGITFVPKADYKGNAVITFSGYGDGRQSFAGTIQIEVEGQDDVTYTTTANAPVTLQVNDFNTICRSNTGRDLNYVIFELPPSARGTLYYNYTGQAVYAEQVVGGTQYFRNRSPRIDSITFIPAKDYTGTVRFSYRAVDTSAGTYNGRVTIHVSTSQSSGSGDVNYEGDHGTRIRFRASDFNTACREAIGETLNYVRFTLPPTSEGTLYYNYSSSSSSNNKVTEGTRYYRSSTPALNNISFVPASTASDRVSIDFTGYGTDGDRFSGTVVIQYGDEDGEDSDGAVSYTTRSGRAIEFDAADFNDMCREVTGANLSYVRFEELPASSRGTLYYNYTSSSSTGSRVSESTRYYRSGTSPMLSKVSFVPKSGYTGTVSIPFIGYDVNNRRIDGRVRITVEESTVDQTVRYAVRTGGSVTFNASDFNSLCQEVESSNLNYVRFELPASSRGTLYYQSGSGSSSSRQKVNASTSYYRTGSNRLLDDVSFEAAGSYTGTVNISFTATCSNGRRFSGNVEIRVYEPVAEAVRYSSGALPTTLRGSDFRRVCNALLKEDLSYIQFTSLPDSSAGRLYQNYSGYRTGTPVTANTSYYYSGTPGLDSLTFVPRAGFQGTAHFAYTARDGSGDRINGTVEITVFHEGSSYFSDLYDYGWAAPAVDFLHDSGVVSGTGSGTFGPSQSIQRCDFVLMLCRAFDLNTGGSSSFPDVPAGSYYAQAVATARELGIATGSNGRFMPYSAITRQDAMVMLQRALIASGQSVPGGDTTVLSSYADGGQTAGYARNAMASMVQLGVLSGNDARRLMPQGTVTRAEMAVILHRVMTM